MSEPSAGDVALGIWLAWKLSRPFNGELVPDAIGAELDREITAAPTAALSRMPDELDGGRVVGFPKAIAFLIARGEAEVQAIATALTRREAPAQPIPLTTDAAAIGAEIVGGRLEIRSSDNHAWHVTDLNGRGGGELLSWHPTAAAARQWAVEHMMSGTAIAKAAANQRPFTE